MAEAHNVLMVDTESLTTKHASGAVSRSIITLELQDLAKDAGPNRLVHYTRKTVLLSLSIRLIE